MGEAPTGSPPRMDREKEAQLAGVRVLGRATADPLAKESGDSVQFSR